jgi:hypothetical protein
MRTQIDLYRKQAWWEATKAVAVILTAATAMAGLILAVSHFIK